MNQIYLNNPILKVLRRMLRVLKVKVIIQKKKKNFLQVENASISCALPRKYTKRSVQGSKKTNIAFSVKIVMKIITITFIVNFVSKFTRIVVRMRMMINGSAVIIAKGGYLISYT